MNELDRMEILLVENSLENANIIIRAIKRDRPHCRVSLVRDGLEAVRLLRRHGEFSFAPMPNLIVLNIHLPKNDGRIVLAALQGSAELKDIPLVVLTGHLVSAATVQVRELTLDGLAATPMEVNKFIGAGRSHRSPLLRDLARCSQA